jgi:DNA (cytosine-5)-methyltransferase 1
MNTTSAIARIVNNIREADGFTALGACIFGGGFSFGIEEAGFTVAGHLELPNLALGSDISSRRWPVLLASVSGANPSWHTAVDRMKNDNAIPDVLYMNPPCVAYAQQGSHLKMEDDAMDFTRSCCNLGLLLGPKVWAWELVPGIFDDITSGGRAFIDSTAKRAAREGYQTYLFLTSSANHGGFQNRKRFHFIASKVHLDFEAMYAAEPDSRRGFRTLGDALDLIQLLTKTGTVPPNHQVDGKQPGGGLLDILPFCPPGGYLRDVPDEIMQEHYRPYGREWNGKSRAGVTQVRGRRDRPCPVIIGGTSVIHPEEDRFLTVREAATVMGFPMDYEFSATVSSGMSEVGKGLCTHNAAFLGRTLADGLDRAVAVTDISEPVVVDWRDRTKVPSMASTQEERDAWFEKRHPALFMASPELAKPRPKGKAGRPKGSSSSNRGKSATKPTVMVWSPNGVTGLDEAFEGLGLEVVDVPVVNPEEETETDFDFEAALEAAHGADALIVAAMNFEATLLAGACLSGGGKVYANCANCEPVVRAFPRIEVIAVAEASRLAAKVATDCGIDPSTVIQQMMKGQDPAELLAMLLNQRAAS